MNTTNNACPRSTDQLQGLHELSTDKRHIIDHKMKHCDAPKTLVTKEYRNFTFLLSDDQTAGESL